MATGSDVTRYNFMVHTPRRRRGCPKSRSHQLAVFITLCLCLAACGIYSAAEITGIVIDADTNLPLEGVHVVAQWVVRGGTNYGTTVGYMNVMETVTDHDGRFHFPQWGPRPNLHLGEIRREAPALMLFKGGYRYAAKENAGSSSAAAPSSMKSHWNEKTIAMERYGGTTPDYDAGYTALWTDLTFLRDHGYWSAVPRFLCAVSSEHESLSRHGVSTALYSLDAVRAAGLDCSIERDPR